MQTHHPFFKIYFFKNVYADRPPSILRLPKTFWDAAKLRSYVKIDMLKQIVTFEITTIENQVSQLNAARSAGTFLKQYGQT